MWSEKYRPKKIAQMIGNEASRLKFYNWLKNWRIKTKPVMLLGPPGTGKTTIVHLIAEEFGYTLVELNASDFRSKTVLESKVGPVLTSTTLFDAKLLIFLDEVDGIESREDYGAVDYILELAKKVNHPVVMAANSEEAKPVERLAKKSEVIQLVRVSARSLELYAKHILDKEGVKMEQEVLYEVVGKSRGDVRAMINTLQELSASKALSPHLLSIRDEQLSIHETLARLSMTESLEEAVKLLRSTSERDTREKLRSVYLALISSQLEWEDLAPVLEAFSQLDLLTYQSELRGNYRLRRYFDTLLAKSIFNVRKSLKHHRYETDTLPFNLRLRLWNDSRTVRRITARMSRLYPLSRREASSYLPYVAVMYGKHPPFASEVKRVFDLDDSSTKFMAKEGNHLLKMLE